VTHEAGIMPDGGVNGQSMTSLDDFEVRRIWRGSSTQFETPLSRNLFDHRRSGVVYNFSLVCLSV